MSNVDEIEAVPEAAGEGVADPPADASASSEEGAAGRDPAEGESEEEALPPLVPVLEAALFASAEAVPLTRLTRVLGAWTRKQVVAGLKELAERQEREGAGVRVVETGGGFQLRSVADYAPWVRKFFTEKPPRLSRAVLETLAIVAYRQPATRGEVEAVRGVNCDAVLGALTARGLIQVIGRRPTPGRPVEYGTTTEFLELFSIRELAELPPLPDASSLANLIEEAHLETQEEGGEEASVSDGDEPVEAVGAAPDHDGGGEPEASQEEAGERGEAYGEPGATAEDLEPGGDRLAPVGGRVDPGGSGPGQREGDPGARGEG